MNIASRPPDRHAASRGRSACIAWLLAVVLVFQLLLQTQHDHEHASKSHHCVACVLHATPLAGPPVATVAVASSQVLVVLYLQPLQVFTLSFPAAAWLLPPAHAPPAFLHT